MSRHWKFSTGRHFQNGHHNTAKIQHCPISSKFDMWVDNDVPNWFIIYPNMKCCWNWTMLNLCGIVVAILKLVTGRNFSMLGINSGHIIYPHIKFWWYRTMSFHMWVDYDVPNWFLTSTNFYRSPFSKWSPQYRTNSTLSDFNDNNVEFLWYCVGHFENGDR
jgi:hypothetical protein